MHPPGGRGRGERKGAASGGGSGELLLGVRAAFRKDLTNADADEESISSALPGFGGDVDGGGRKLHRNLYTMFESGSALHVNGERIGEVLALLSERIDRSLVQDALPLFLKGDR